MSALHPKPVQLLFLSDIHFGNSSSSPDFAPRNDPPKHAITHAVSMRESLVATMASRNLDGLVVGGDLTASGGPTEFKECWDVVNGIANDLNISKNSVFPVFGNHDVDWSISRLSDSTNGRRPDDLYRHVASSVGDQFLKPPKCSSFGPLPGTGVYDCDKYVIYAANTGFFCCHDQKYPHGRIGDEQLRWLKDELARSCDPAKWRILLMHHHPFNYMYPVPAEDISCIQEGAEIVDLIGTKGLDFVCHGHRHHPILFTEMRSGWIHPVTFLCAGSLAAGSDVRLEGQIPNLFHVVSLRSRDQKHGAIGCVETFFYTAPIGWVPVNKHSPLVPLDSERVFGGVATDEERSTDTFRVLTDVMAKDPVSLVLDLPSFTELPISLQCMPWEDLNRLFCTSAARLKGIRLLGEFPKPVILQRIKP